MCQESASRDRFHENPHGGRQKAGGDHPHPSALRERARDRAGLSKSLLVALLDAMAIRGGFPSYRAIPPEMTFRQFAELVLEREGGR